MPHKNKQKNTSLCEKAMEVMINIIKLSSLSSTTLTLCDTNRPIIAHAPNPSFSDLSNSDFSKNKRSKSQVNKSKTQTFVMEQDAGDAGDRGRSSSTMTYGGNIDDESSEYIGRFHTRNQNEAKTESADENASAYIRRFHGKIARDNTLAAPASFPLVVPPPPSCFKK